MSYEDILDEVFLNLPTDPFSAFIIFFERVDTKRKQKMYDAYEFVLAIETFINTYNLDLNRHYNSNDYSYASLANNNLGEYYRELRQIRMIHQIELARANSMAVFDAVEIHDKFKTDIRKLINEVKEKIDKTSIEQDKKDSLFKKLNHFLHELDQSKTRLAAFTSAQIQLASATGKAAEELEPAISMLERITKAIGIGSKKQEQLPPWEEQKQIEAPKKQIEHQPEIEEEATE